MPLSLPKYVKRVRSKGREYLYFDTGKSVDGKKVYTRLPPLRDPKFGGSYAALMGHRNRGAKVEALMIPRMVDLYQRSDDYCQLAAASKKLYDIYLHRLAKLLPTAPAVEVTRGDMLKLRDGMATTPSAASAFIGAAGAMFAWAKDREYIPLNPCDGLKLKLDGEHQAWPEPVLRAALASDDQRVRLLAHLLYYTAQRLGDVLRMQWTDIEGERVNVVQQKTGKPLSIRLHRALQKELERQPRSAPTIVANALGKPLSGDMARKALKVFTAGQGAPCVPHGLRKNAVITLLEVGCSMAQTAAVSGQTLRVVEYYARARDQAKLAGSAMDQWEGSERDSTN